MNPLDVGYIALVGLTAPVWARKARGGWKERLGRVEPLPPKTRPRVMLHAVSVGEVNALRQLIPLLAPHVEVLLTVGTDTGLARARELFEKQALIRRYPLDFSFSVDWFLDAAAPDAVGLVELELWPNFVSACKLRGIPIGVVNGRLSERSFKGYRKIRGIIGKHFAALDFAAVQDAEYASRFEYMGVRPNQCFITGSMKFDAGTVLPAGVDAVASTPGAAELAAAMGIDRTRPLIVAGSTAPDEHTLLHNATPEGVQLLCAPRRPEWFDQAAKDLAQPRHGHSKPGICVRRSQKVAAPSGTDRYLLDTIGELRAAYALADVVVVGRSFGELFGSDPIEPIGLGKATLIGPAITDFRHIVETLDRAGGIVRVTRDSLHRTLVELLKDPAGRAALAEAGQACIRSQQGASDRHAQLLLSVVNAGARTQANASG